MLFLDEKKQSKEKTYKVIENQTKFMFQKYVERKREQKKEHSFG